MFQNVVDEILKDVFFYYVNMGASQFLKDFRLHHKIEKSAEIRKKVLQRKAKLKLKNDKVPFEVLITSDSNNYCMVITIITRKRYTALQCQFSLIYKLFAT